MANGKIYRRRSRGVFAELAERWNSAERDAARVSVASIALLAALTNVALLVSILNGRLLVALSATAVLQPVIVTLC